MYKLRTEMLLKPIGFGYISLFSEGLPTDEEGLTTSVDVIELVEKTIIRWIQETSDSRLAIIPDRTYVISFFRPRGY
jgi:hypothetical protein